MCDSTACDHASPEAVRTIPVWMPAPNGPLRGVQIRERGLFGPHWDGTRVAFVPGVSGAKEDFVPLMEELVATGRHRLFALDQCGQNETPGVDDPAAYTLPSLADDLAVAITAVCARKPVHLVGQGAGALVAASAVALSVGRRVAHPSRYVSLTLLSPVWEGVAKAAGLGCCDREGLAAAQHRGGVLDPARRQVVQQRLARSHPVSLRQLATATAHADLAAQVRAAGVPVLVVRGEEDRLVDDAAGEELARALDAEYRVVPEAGHLTYHDNPAQLGRMLLDFWDGLGENTARSAAWLAH
ncbi:alpha/beta fold hydrolase [Streptomyces polyrhachis]|uniref:Alpha/beta fold hydrolase n=1 Tax=Streptomyces polyrhachis TaxID=1282885 RepID=A0ABW2GK04_9ACTN